MPTTREPFTNLRELLRSGRRHVLAKDDMFQTTDDREVITLVNKGYIKRYLITKEGNESIQIIHGPDSVFPLTPLYKLFLSQNIYSGPETFYYQAMCDCELFAISRETLQQAIEADPLLYRDLLYVSGTRLNEYVHSLENIAMASSYHRVAHQLLFYANYFGEITPKGVKILIPLTQQNLANVLNITRETTSVSMGKLRERGLIDGAKSLVVPNKKALEEEVYSL